MGGWVGGEEEDDLNELLDCLGGWVGGSVEYLCCLGCGLSSGDCGVRGVGGGRAGAWLVYGRSSERDGLDDLESRFPMLILEEVGGWVNRWVGGWVGGWVVELSIPVRLEPRRTSLSR